MTTKGKVGIVHLNRPEALNALSSPLIKEVTETLWSFDANPGIGAVVLTGGAKVFAAGADIKEMASRTFGANVRDNFLENWASITRIKKPLIAAVAGYALGGGCELAMMCDIVYAASNAKFGQPEIKLGILPGGGGTQRLVRAFGKSRAMELILTGDTFGPEEAERHGLVSKIFTPENVVDKAVELGNKISEMSMPISILCKECINASFESSLAEGLRLERRLFQACFGLNDQKIGMKAFLDKATPQFKNE